VTDLFSVFQIGPMLSFKRPQSPTLADFFNQHSSADIHLRDNHKMSLESIVFHKYKTVQSFKLHFLQSSPLVQLYTSASGCKGVGNIPVSHFVKTFSALPSHS